jgi:hypothetical protein
MSKPLKKAKHPSEMTTDEALKHVFHPKVVKHVKGLVAATFKTPIPKAPRTSLKRG